MTEAGWIAIYLSGVLLIWFGYGLFDALCEANWGALVVLALAWPLILVFSTTVVIPFAVVYRLGRLVPPRK